MSNHHIPCEIVEEIISKLRCGKSLMRLKCISKSCLALISDPTFFPNRKKLLSFEFSNGCRSLDCLLTSTFSEIVPINIDFDPPSSITRIADVRSKSIIPTTVGSYNGLVCILVVTFYRYDDPMDCQMHEHLFIWNPFTGEYKKLPHIPESGSNWGSYALGFGFDLSTHEYKVVAVERSHQAPDKMKFVFTARTNSWRRIEEDNVCSKKQFPSMSYYLNGALYWLAQKLNRNSYQEFNIITFDLAEEKFREISLPYSSKMSGLLGVIEGQLCFHCHNELWVMKEYGAWEKMIKFFYDDDDDPVPPDVWWFTGCGDKEVMMLCRDLSSGEFYLLKPNSKNKKSERFSINSNQVIEYVETFISPT